MDLCHGRPYVGTAGSRAAKSGCRWHLLLLPESQHCLLGACLPLLGAA